MEFVNTIMREKPKIIQIVNRYQRDAISNIVRNIVYELKDLYDFEIWSYEKVDRNSITGRYSLSDSIALRDFGATHKVGSGWYEIGQELRNKQPKIVQFHGGRACVLGPMLAKFARIPVIINTIHNVFKNYSQLIKGLFRFSNLLVDVNACVSKTVEASFFSHTNGHDVLKEKNLPHHLTIPNFIDIKRMRREAQKCSKDKTRQMLNLSSGEKFILNIGQLIRQKDQFTLLKAFSLLLREKNGLFLGVMGDGPLREELHSICKKLGILDHVNFLGYRKDVYRILGAADLFVSTSLWEGMPLSHLEAMALGKPIVATKIPSVQELITNGNEGVLVEPKNPEAFKNAILNLISSKDKMKLLGEAARAKVEDNHNLTTGINHYRSLYQTCLGSG